MRRRGQDYPGRRSSPGCNGLGISEGRTAASQQAIPHNRRADAHAMHNRRTWLIERQPTRRSRGLTVCKRCRLVNCAQPRLDERVLGKVRYQGPCFSGRSASLPSAIRERRRGRLSKNFESQGDLRVLRQARFCASFATAKRARLTSGVKSLEISCRGVAQPGSAPALGATCRRNDWWMNEL